MDNDTMIPLSQAAQMLPASISKETLRTWCKRGVGGRKLRFAVIGSRIFVKPSWLAEFLRHNGPQLDQANREPVFI